MRTLTGKLENVAFYDTSRNGNTRYTAHIDGVQIFTAVDGCLGSALKNYADKRVSLTVRLVRGKLVTDGKPEVLPEHPDAAYYRAQFAHIDTSTEYKATIQAYGPDGRATNHMNVTADQLRAIEAVMCDPVLAGLKGGAA